MQKRVDWRALAGWATFLWLAALIVGYYVIHKPLSPGLALNLARLVWELGVALAILSVAGGIGRRSLSKISLQPLAALALQAGFGFGMLSLGVLAAGYAGLFRPLFTGPGLLVLGILFWRDCLSWWKSWRALKTLWQSSDWFGRATGWLTLLILGFTLLTALAPPIKFDALVYHLALPRQYLLVGRMVYIPQNMFWGMPQTAEMLYTWAMSLGGEPAAVVLGWLAGLVTLLGLMGLIADRLGIGPACAGVAALICGLTLSSGLAWGYNDWWVILFGLGFLISLAKWAEDHSPGLLALSGLFAGLALSTKYTAGLILMCGSVVILWNWKSAGVRGTVKALFQFGLPALLVFIPWLLKNWLATGNPFYPILFPAGAMSGLRLALYQGGEAWGNWLDFVILPVRATLMGLEGGPGYSASIGPLLVGLSLAVVLIWWATDGQPWGPDEQPRSLIRVSALAAITGFLVWMVAGRFTSYLLQSRLYLSFFPVLAVLAGAGYAGLARLNLSGVRLGRVTGFLILLVLGLNVLETGLQTTSQGAAKAILGLSTPDQYLADNLGWYAPAMQALDKLPAGARVLMLWEARSLYCLPVCEPDEIIDRWERERHERGGSNPATPEEIIQSWKEAGYTHLLFYRLGADFIRSQSSNIQADDWTALEATLRQLSLVQDFGDTYQLYRIAP
jgi:hypothetical protein